MRAATRRPARSPARGALVLAPLLLALLAPGCAQPSGPPNESASSGGGTEATSSAPPSAEAASADACATFWGDPTYATPLSRDVLDRAATAAANGPDDPAFYAMTGDDIDAGFAHADSGTRDAAQPLAAWMREQPRRGQDADMDAFVSSWRDLAAACAPHSAAATWASGAGETGTKPSALVCADIVDTPSTLTVFANANVLTSNLFKLVGRAPRTVPADRMAEVRAADQLLTEEIGAAEPGAVRDSLEDVRAPLRDALKGDLHSDGLQGPLDRLADACTDADYFVPPSGEGDDEGLA